MLCVAGLFFGCSSSCQATSQTGAVPLEFYDYTGPALTTDTVYRVIRSKETFAALFQATNAAARRPSFNGQTAVAILMKAAPLRFVYAAMQGKAVYVYAQTCSETGCTSGRVVLATIPNVGRAQTLQFFINGKSMATVNL